MFLRASDYPAIFRWEEVFNIRFIFDFVFIDGADAFSRQVVKMMNDKLIAPYGMLVEKDKEIERLNRLIGRLQNEIEELKKGSAQTENPAECANAV